MKSPLKSKRPYVYAVRVIALYGVPQVLRSIVDAIDYLRQHKSQDSPSKKGAKLQFIRYEILIRYSDKSRVEGEFPTKTRAMEWLKKQEAVESGLV